MFLFIAAIVIAVILGVTAFLSDDLDVTDVCANIAFFILVGTGIWAVLGTAILQGNSIAAKNASHMIELKTQQRDELLATIRDEMSSDEYVKLISATSTDDITVIFGSGVSEFLIARAQNVIALNQSVNDLVYEVEQKKVGVCNYVQNPFLMRLPFVSPDCEI